MAGIIKKILTQLIIVSFGLQGTSLMSTQLSFSELELIIYTSS